MTKIQARIDESLKIEGEKILKKMGITTTELMRMTFRQMVMRKGLPFDVRIPNAETVIAFDEAEKPAKHSVYSDTKRALDDTWGDD